MTGAVNYEGGASRGATGEKLDGAGGSGAGTKTEAAAGARTRRGWWAGAEGGEPEVSARAVGLEGGSEAMIETC